MKNQIIVTPKGELVYPHLSKPDTKFDKDGVYRTVLKTEYNDEAKAFARKLEELVDEYAHQLGKKTKRAPLPFKINEEDGTLEVTLKCKAKGIRNDGTTWEQKPVIFDSKGTPFEPDGVIWGGTVAKISFTPSLYSVAAIGTGISLRLKAVQIIDLVKGGNSSDTYGFTEEEGHVSTTEKSETNYTLEEEGETESANLY
jgi:hypothetical protein|tara:strand:- start:490 stop:1086 length:597 start_codon:yes stop_codon:yes gene_type:complete